MEGNGGPGKCPKAERADGGDKVDRVGNRRFFKKPIHSTVQTKMNWRSSHLGMREIRDDTYKAKLDLRAEATPGEFVFAASIIVSNCGAQARPRTLSAER
jgi:hypothetical protein